MLISQDDTRGRLAGHDPLSNVIGPDYQGLIGHPGILVANYWYEFPSLRDPDAFLCLR